MPIDTPTSSGDSGRVINFRRRGVSSNARMAARSPVEDLARYERGADAEDSDDYRHRMAINIIAVVFVAALIAAGLWIADTMAAMRKNQDCVLSGRSGCTPVEVPHTRW
jgi:hypothetical protein